MCTYIEIPTSVRKRKASSPSTSGVNKAITLLSFSFNSPFKPPWNRWHLSVSPKNYMNKQGTAKERPRPSGFLQVLLCRRCWVYLYNKRRTYRRIGFHPPATEDYDVGDSRNIISFCDSFRCFETQVTPDLEESFDIDTRIRAATAAFMAMKDIFRQNYQSEDLQRIVVYTDTNERRSTKMRFLSFESDSSRWDYRFERSQWKQSSNTSNYRQ
jgi:hypothetical protein